ncbi:TIGR02391 family protein [Micromonospora zamorensis]|uniref:TIGR02391 family protein n=1 Tax=Micromonospora TaxID=1873 RepID=UPI0033B0BD87
MRPAVAIEELTKLKAEAEAADLFRQREGLESWKHRVRMIFVRTLGTDNHIVESFDKVRYSPTAISGGMPRSAYEERRRSGVLSVMGLTDAAIYELQFSGGGEPVDEYAYDPDLWSHVKGLVDDEEWGKVASQTAIFVENHVRTWAGNPQDRNDNNLVGKALYLKVFDDASDYRLGRQASEREGWRYLGMGFAQALSNVDRHRIQTRDDAKRYALGVLGLGSLLLTQLRYEHSDILKTE